MFYFVSFLFSSVLFADRFIEMELLYIRETHKERQECGQVQVM